jgi:hypothetical protein
MGSVYVNWQGTCRERKTQEELVGMLRQIADLSAMWILGADSDSPEAQLSKLLWAGRQALAPELDCVRVFDTEIVGNIVLDPFLAVDGHALKADVDQGTVDMVSIAAGGTKKNEPGCLSLTLDPGQVCLVLKRLKLYGVDFRLYDYRNLYPQANRMSFVFIESPELPSLKGCLAQIEDKTQCQSYGSETIRSADYFVSQPNIHMRYFLEEWSDMLLSFVKYFFVQDLEYFRYESCMNYDVHEAAFEAGCEEIGREAAKQAAHKVLLQHFENAADKEEVYS